jgi:hypothetical protein
MVDPMSPDIDNLTDEQFEELCAKMPKRSEEEVQADLNEFLAHPLNCAKVTPTMLDSPEYQALQEMAFEGTPDEVGKNFLNHALEQLETVLLKKSKNEEKDIQEAYYCFEQAFDAKPTDETILFGLY